MSPQLREACIRGTNYNAFKADVFSLGASLLHMITLNSPETLLASERLDEAVSRQVQTLSCSPQFRHLLRCMLAAQEDARPSMQDLSSIFREDIPLQPALTCGGTHVAKPTYTEETKYLKDIRVEQPKEGSTTELVHVTHTFLSFFELSTSTWGPRIRLSTPIQANGGSSWVMLEGRVFCCGGPTAAAYILARDGTAERKNDMSEIRYGHGLQTAYNTAYVFGGVHLETCEKWEEATNKWRNLPSMREGRYSFNPCLCEGRMYLCGGLSASMEVFDPQTDYFLRLLISLPQASACCVFVHNHLLVVHSRTYILRFAVKPDGQLTKYSEVRSPKINKYQNSQPVVDKAKGVFYMIWCGRCICMETETGVKVALE